LDENFHRFGVTIDLPHLENNHSTCEVSLALGFRISYSAVFYQPKEIINCIGIFLIIQCYLIL